MPALTLLDIAKRTNNDAVIGTVEEVLTNAPEMREIIARTKAGTSYNIHQRTKLPEGGFRSANEGIALTASETTQKLAQMFFCDTQLRVDEAVVQADDGELGDLLAFEAAGAVLGTFNVLGKQTWYGENATSKGFQGLRDQISTEINATGETAVSSAYLLWMPPTYQGVHLDVGLNGQMNFPEWRKQSIADGNGNPYTAYVSNMSFYIGLTASSDFSVFRVANLTTAKPLTDALGAELLSKIPVARRGNLRWFINREVAFQLQKSRSAVGQVAASSSGAPAFAPLPTELQGIPITVTDSLVSNETPVTFA
jgi:hypothetical protein